MTEQILEAAIIGAGPIGLELAVALKRAGIQYIHLEKGQIGQTIMHFPPMVQFFSSIDRIMISGVPIPLVERSKCTREEYLAYLRGIVRQFKLEVRTYEEVISIERLGEQRFQIQTKRKNDNNKYITKNIVFANGDMAHPRFLDIPGEELPHVSHSFDEPHKYFRQKVLIVGGKNSAIEAALKLYHAGADVSISYWKKLFDPAHIKYWLFPEFEGRIQREEIRTYMNTIPKHISSTRITLEDVVTDSCIDVETDFVLLLVGYIADTTLLRGTGVDVDEQDVPVFNEQTMETNVQGIYVAGTAIAGTQSSYKIFIENCHVHADKILASLKGEIALSDQKIIDQPES